MKKYSAGAVKHSFWFNEFQSMLSLRHQYSSDDIKKMVINDNYWDKKSENVSRRTYVAVKKRVDTLSNNLIDLFDYLDLENQKIVNIVAIMDTMKLMRDFMYEVYRPQIIIGDSKIEDFEITAFFKNLEASHEEVANWTDQTKQRLRGTIKTFLREANLVTDEDSALLIQKPLLDPRLEDQLTQDGHGDYVAIFLGR